MYRAALLGAMSKTEQMGPEARRAIWRNIMEAPPYSNGRTTMSLPDAYRVSCDDFWKSFSLGEFDDASIFIYTAVTSHFQDSEKTPGQVVAEYLYHNNMREIDMMLSAAGPIIQEGCNIVFAAGDDLISWGQTAYDYVEKNGQVILQKCKGNLTAETCADAFNTNLKILMGQLEEIYPQSGDLAGVLADFTTDQIKAFNKAIQEAITSAGSGTLSEENLSWFTSQVQEIIGIKHEPSFLNQTFFNKDDMSQLTIEGRMGHAYEFFYTDRHGNILMEGKCAIDNKYISVRVDESSLNPSCDLLPPDGLPNTGIVTIPYSIFDEGTIILRNYKGTSLNSKYFSIMNDEMTESLFDELTLNMFVTGGMAGSGNETQVMRATKSNGAVFSRDDISTSYFGDGLWVRGSKEFKTSTGTLRHKIEFMLDSNDIFDLSNAKRFSYSCWETDSRGNQKAFWGIFSPEIPLEEDDKEKAVWLAEDTEGNMKVTNLINIVDHKTVCNTYVKNPGTNRIEINVLKGEMPKQLEVKPKVLEFKAEGGEQAITVKKGYFQLSNCFWEENQQWGWSTQFDNDSTIVVTLPENQTTEERTTSLIIWAANKPYNQLDMEKDVFDTVMVTVRQLPAETGPQGRFEIVGGHVGMDIRTEYETSMGELYFTAGDGIVSMTPKGKGVHFELKWDGSEDKYTDVVQCTFDLDDISLLPANKASITGISWKRQTNNWSGPYGHHWWGIWGGTDHLLRQKQDIAFSSSQKLGQSGWNEPWNSEYWSANFWAFDQDIPSPSACYFHRWSLGQYVDGEAEVVSNGDEMLEGSSLTIDLWLKYVEE